MNDDKAYAVRDIDRELVDHASELTMRLCAPELPVIMPFVFVKAATLREPWRDRGRDLIRALVPR